MLSYRTPASVLKVGQFDGLAGPPMGEQSDVILLLLTTRALVQYRR